MLVLLHRCENMCPVLLPLCGTGEFHGFWGKKVIMHRAQSLWICKSDYYEASDSGFLFLFFCFVLFERERESVSGGEGQRERKRESQADSTLSMGSQDPGIMTWAQIKSDAQPTEPLGCPSDFSVFPVWPVKDWEQCVTESHSDFPYDNLFLNFLHFCFMYFNFSTLLHLWEGYDRHHESYLLYHSDIDPNPYHILITQSQLFLVASVWVSFIQISEHLPFARHQT